MKFSIVDKNKSSTTVETTGPIAFWAGTEVYEGTTFELIFHLVAKEVKDGGQHIFSEDFADMDTYLKHWIDYMWGHRGIRLVKSERKNLQEL